MQSKPEWNIRSLDGVKNKDPVYLRDTVVRIKKTGQFALINQLHYLHGGFFYYYLGQIEGRGDGNYVLFHDDIEFECQPRDQPNT